MSIWQLTKAFWKHLSNQRKRQFVALLFLIVLASFAEVLSLGAVLPFLGVIAQPDKVFAHPAIQPLLGLLGIEAPHELLLPMTVIFIVAALLAGAVRLLLLRFSTKLSYGMGADFSHDIYRHTLYQPYAVHLARNSSEIISGVTNKVSIIISNLLTPVLTLISSAFVLIAILAALLAIDLWMSLTAFIGFGAIYGVIIFVTRRRLAAISVRLSQESTKIVRVLQEGLGGIRDVLIDGTQETYCRQYRQADIPLRDAQASSVIIGTAPRFTAEALGMSFIAILAYFLTSKDSGVANTITLLGVLALGAQRLLPVLQQGYQSVVQLRSGQYSLQDALDLLNQPIDYVVHESNADLLFQRAIELRDLGFRYVPESPQVLLDLNLYIPRGSRTGFIGATGSGKSTLLDIIMGLLSPTEGGLWVDDMRVTTATQRAWQRRIAHVPQAIYLSDASITENIAFGLPVDEIDLNRVRSAAQQAQIADYIEALPERYETHVGERGVRLSGGQRQRIGIARALYKQAEVIIFDEATSALDNETERAVMDAIDGLGRDLTILMIAHRLSTLQRCDRIVELSRGRIVRTGTYDEMVGHTIHPVQSSNTQQEPNT
ncbi:ABC transporter ATP-binding protein [Castellaniella ginsengisoli]|uniref:Cyclolysin secretion/processing ATP-binding protein CyaB n=1 Tax=Castellaniella ginsengisoli TaxID=546114 RepID=A0AB39D4A9_9BURK